MMALRKQLYSPASLRSPGVAKADRLSGARAGRLSAAAGAMLPPCPTSPQPPAELSPMPRFCRGQCGLGKLGS